MQSVTAAFARVWSAAGRRPRWQHVTFALCLIALVGWVDRVTGEQLSVSILYAAPVILLAWFVGRRAGIAGAFLCGAIRLALALEADGSAPALIAVGNTDVELGFFLLCAFAFGTLKEALDREEARARGDDVSRGSSSD